MIYVQQENFKTRPSDVSVHLKLKPAAIFATLENLKET
jgi:hypothetical protein